MLAGAAEQYYDWRTRDTGDTGMAGQRRGVAARAACIKAVPVAAEQQQLQQF
jgi:hypothetical protein